MISLHRRVTICGICRGGTALDFVRRTTDAHGRQPPIHVIEGAGHAVYLQKPSEFASILNRLVTADENAEFRAILPEET